jgi:hypothetical protein
MHAPFRPTRPVQFELDEALLARAEAGGLNLSRVLAEAVAARRVLVDPLQCRPIPRHLLNDPVATLADDESATRIIAAMDEVPTRADR